MKNQSIDQQTLSIKLNKTTTSGSDTSGERVTWLDEQEVTVDEFPLLTL